MKLTLIVLAAILAAPFCLFGQSKTTEALEKKYSDSRALFFYHNTLRMINQQEDKDFDDLIRDIEKMKLLMIHKDQKNFDFKKLVGDYRAEAFEEIMTSRHQGKNFNIYIKEDINKKTKGMLVLVNDSTDLYVLDIVGSIALDKVTKFYSRLDESADIGRSIKAFANREEKNKKQKKNE